MGEDLEKLKQRLPLLDYLRQQNWQGRPAARGAEFVGLCPLHPEKHPSFYVNPRKNLFYCHGCGQGGDLIRFVQLSRQLSFRQALAYLEPELASPDATAALEDTAAFYQQQLACFPEALRYLEARGILDPGLIKELGIGYAPGGTLRRYLTARGYSLDRLQQLGLITPQGHDALCQRITLPCCENQRIVNLYGRSVGPHFAHRFLPGSRGGLFAWESVRQFSTVILVEGLFDLAILWQVGFRNTTCAFGVCLTAPQFRQIAEPPGRHIYIAFDSDENQTGQQASQALGGILRRAGLEVSIVQLPTGEDPNTFFVHGACAADFILRLQGAQPL
ncbi:MAG: CHC2 zinc finger domain-containing protein [Terriglobia bacterium]